MMFRKLSYPIISTQFTLVPDEQGEPMIAEHLKKIRPFLSKGDFATGSWGNQLVDELGVPDYLIEKIAYSAFYMTRLEWLLNKLNIKNLIVGGIVTNGGVASTARNAHVLGFGTTILSDGCAAFSADIHHNAILDLSTVSDVKTCAEIMAMFK
jgi:nicotinamidase-related amidase